jgi:hypothetical protein
MVHDTDRFVRRQIKSIGSALFFVKAEVLFHRSAPEFYGYNFRKNPDGTPLVLAESPDVMCMDKIRNLQAIIKSREEEETTEKKDQPSKDGNSLRT